MDVMQRLIQIMEREDLTAYELAKKCEISPSTITTMFRREKLPSIPTLQKICKGLDISMAEFFYEDDGRETFEKKYHKLTNKSKEIILFLLEKLD